MAPPDIEAHHGVRGRPSVSAILLAAGRSRRMGMQKALLPWGEATLLDYQLHQLAAVDAVTEIVVVTGYNAEALMPRIDGAAKARTAHNAAFDDGKAGSVRTGASAVDARAWAVLLLAVDQPRPAALLRTLVEAHARGASITAPACEGRRGHPLMFDAALLPELRAVDEASLGVRAVLERHAAAVRDVTIDDPAALVDINTPEDAVRARELPVFAAASAEGGRRVVRG
ncbi:MAG: nucleotidyltransferase family protein [Dehalococcoidia bacterium]|nr:nucleotidyltransferase family protein [Dehalococcoidia bacterium]